MERADQQQVGELGLATVGPERQVMGLGEPAGLTPGEPAGPVPRARKPATLEGARNKRRAGRETDHGRSPFLDKLNQDAAHRTGMNERGRRSSRAGLPVLVDETDPFGAQVR